MGHLVEFLFGLISITGTPDKKSSLFFKRFFIGVVFLMVLSAVVYVITHK
jgi:hypothetical protein